LKIASPKSAENRDGKQYDFSKGRCGAVLKVPPGKTRVTIRLDNDVLDGFAGKLMPRAAGTTRL
jgi:uncharacterized protein (DUF4415 family)